jgi:hypothetical protein
MEHLRMLQVLIVFPSTSKFWTDVADLNIWKIPPPPGGKYQPMSFAGKREKI